MDEITLSRFTKHIHITSDCWTWTGYLDKGGYGRFNLNGVNETTHKLMYVHCFGMPDNGLHICHKPIICHNRACCNPDHLEAKSPTENQADKILDKTGAKKLNSHQIIEIRKRFGESHRQLAKEFGVSQSFITRILNNKIWKHII